MNYICALFDAAMQYVVSGQIPAIIAHIRPGRK